jgi:predicted dehydrogenase
MKPLRVAVVGAGHLGRIHSRLAAAAPDIELVAVADPVEASRDSVVQECNNVIANSAATVNGGTSVRGVADYRTVVGDVEAIIVAAPTSLHHAIGMDLLNRGLPVLMEKPLAPTTAECDDLVALAGKKGLVLQVGHVERFNPALEAVASDVRDPKYIDATRTSGYTFRSTDVGVVLDVMIHDLDIVLALAKSTVVDVQALGVSVLGSHEDMATVRLSFASGCVANISASRVSFQQKRTMTVFTSRGIASINFATNEATVVKPREDVLRREFRVEQLSPNERAYWKENLFTELLVRTQCNPPAANAIQEEQRDFVAAIREKRAPRVDGVAGRDAVAVAEMILDCIGEHAWDGTPSGRRGPFAMPALPIIAGTTLPVADAQPRRRAG